MIENMLSILLIEDNASDVELTLDALKTHNLANRVKVLRDGEEAVNYIFRERPDKNQEGGEHPKLILLDLNLPKIDGLEILRRIRADQRTRSIPVVVLTSSLEDRDRIESYKLGVNSYIVKPVDFDNFTRAVAEIGFYWVLLNKAP
jgi:Response regulators consisting of a CheY-like receiver domain and a winged-helix DNA-binding domain